MRVLLQRSGSKGGKKLIARVGQPKIFQAIQGAQFTGQQWQRGTKGTVCSNCDEVPFEVIVFM